MIEVEPVTVAIYMAIFVFGFTTAATYFLKKKVDELEASAKKRSD